ncbi:MAG: thiamine ABC transporter substrate-binding protein [Deinococcus-Thermus bacterium]|jgi:thiamine transport system substrate-binding protein|nr:thiamine ABC transporter substrate-binding protein [Deinococcota bacterium]
MPRPIPTLRALARTALLLLIPLATTGAAAQQVTLITHDSFALPDDLVSAFEEEHGLELRLLTGGDAGAMVNRALLTSGRPVADALFGIDDALIAREGASELFEPYLADGIDGVPDDLRFAGERLTPVTVGYVNFNLHLDGLRERGLPVPRDIAELAEPPFEGATVVSDPATSSPGLAFLLTTVARFGEGGAYDWLDYWADLREADVRVTSGWSDAYYTAFSRYGGDRPIVLSYATSPAAEVIFAEEELDASPTANLLCERCSWRQIEAAGVLAGTGRPDAARDVVDFLLSPEVQEAVPTSMFVYPARQGVTLPEAFDRFAVRPTAEQTATLDAERIEARQARWLEQWTQVVRQGRDPDAVR